MFLFYSFKKVKQFPRIGGGGAKWHEHQGKFTNVRRWFEIGCAEKRRGRAGGIESKKRNANEIGWQNIGFRAEAAIRMFRSEQKYDRDCFVNDRKSSVNEPKFECYCRWQWAWSRKSKVEVISYDSVVGYELSRDLGRYARKPYDRYAEFKSVTSVLVFLNLIFVYVKQTVISFWIEIVSDL